MSKLDEGHFRPPAWFRNQDLEQRYTNAAVPKKWQKYLHDVENTLPAPASDDAHRGNVLLTGPPIAATTRAALALGLWIRDGMSGRWVSSTGYIEMVKAEWDAEDLSLYSSPHIVKYVNHTFDVLVLDGLGEEHGTPFTDKALAMLIKNRSERELITIATTALRPLDITKRYGARAAAYLTDPDVGGKLIQVGR